MCARINYKKVHGSRPKIDLTKTIEDFKQFFNKAFQLYHAMREEWCFQIEKIGAYQNKINDAFLKKLPGNNINELVEILVANKKNLKSETPLVKESIEKTVCGLIDRIDAILDMPVNRWKFFSPTSSHKEFPYLKGLQIKFRDILDNHSRDLPELLFSLLMKIWPEYKDVFSNTASEQTETFSENKDNSTVIET